MKTFFLLLLLTFNAMANTYEIHSKTKDEPRFIKVTSDEKMISFEFCDSKYHHCEQIGPHKSYDKQVLRKKMYKEYGIGTGITSADIIAAGLVAVGGLYVGAALLGTADFLILSIFILGGAGTAMVAVEAEAADLFPKINPGRYFDRGDAIRFVLKPHGPQKDILDIKNNLDDVLHRIH